jgi:hypothetical protein
MSKLSGAWCCAVAALAVSCLATFSMGQDDIFGDPGSQPSQIDSGNEIRTPPAELESGPPAEMSLVKQTDGDSSNDFCRCVGDTQAPTVVKIHEALRSPLKEDGLDFTEMPLEAVVNVLSDEYGIPIKLDRTALEELGVSSDEKVSISLSGISLRAALRLILKDLELTYIIDDEVLHITTPDEAEQQLRTCVYDVRDLPAVTKAGGLERLVDTIISCVATETWAKNGGGEAEVRTLEPGLIVVSQTQAVHEEVGDFLETIRQMRERPAADAAAADKPKVDEGQQVVTRSYILQVQQAEDAASTREQIRRLITQSFPDEQWADRLDDGQPVVLTVLPDRVVLRHRELVQKEVQSLLADSGIATASPAVASNAEGSFGGGGGGFGGGGFGGGGGGFFRPIPADSH